MPNLSPRKTRARYLRSLVRSLGASVLLHAVVLGIFLFGVSQGTGVAQQYLERDWLELGPDISPKARPAKKINSVAAVVPDAASPIPTLKQIEQPTETTSEGTGSPNDSARATAESRYVTELAALLNRAKVYPRESIAREHEGKVVVAVSVDRDGGVHETTIVAASPFRLLNEAALDTVARLGKFPAPPAELLTDDGEHGVGSRRLKIPISFRIERP